jgi:hypothetical protein
MDIGTDEITQTEVSEESVLRRISGPKTEEQEKAGEDDIIRNVLIPALRHTLLW